MEPYASCPEMITPNMNHCAMQNRVHMGAKIHAKFCYTQKHHWATSSPCYNHVDFVEDKITLLCILDKTVFHIFMEMFSPKVSMISLA